MTPNRLFFLTHIAVLLWAAFVIWLAVVTKQAGFISVFFMPVLGLPWLMRRSASSWRC